VGEAALIVANKLTLKDVAQAIHPHPTMTEAFGILAQKMLSKTNESLHPTDHLTAFPLHSIAAGELGRRTSV